MSYERRPAVAAWGSVQDDSREKFIVRTYNHLFVSILAFAGLEVAMFKTGVAATLMKAMGNMGWMLVLGAFMIAAWLASAAAARAESKVAQYAALAAYVGIEAIIFVPLLYIANAYAPGVIQSAAVITIVGFAALTAIVFVTRKDFSFMGAFLRWAGIVALILIVASLIFGFELGVFFSVAMIALAGGAILYETSNVLHHYPEDRYVAAALQLFASVALMFWYVLRLLMELNRR